MFETYERRRQVAQRAGQKDVFTYNEVPSFLRRQLKIILTDSIGIYGDEYQPFKANGWWQAISEIMEKEIASFPAKSYGSTSYSRAMHFLEGEQDIDRWLSFVELACRVLNNLDDEYSRTRERGAKQAGKSAIEEINTRFRQNGLGYEFAAGEIVRVDNEFVHAEIVKPALALLSESAYEKANEDFRTAHRHYRSGEWKDAIVAANRAFESALKAICHLRSWTFDRSARASDLIKIVVKHGLLPDHLDAGLSAYVAMMKTGLPSVRNDAGGHGASPIDPPVSEHLAGYAINMTAANIVLIARANAELGKKRKK